MHLLNYVFQNLGVANGVALQEHAHRPAQSLAHCGLARGGSSLQFAGHGLVIDQFVCLHVKFMSTHLEAP